MLSCILVAAAAIAPSPVLVTERVQDDADLLTVAERSDFTETAAYADVMALIERLDERSDHLRRVSLGTTHEGRDIPLLIIADPPIETPDQARASGKLILFAFGNIHAGEVCGKEALMMLARELARDADHPLLDDIIFVIAPIYNADGNERFAPVEDNRPGQNGPVRTGQRANAQDLDLNRDYIKLEAPETRGLVKLLTDWDPHITIDTHTTNGSHHRYTLTFDAPTNPTGAREPIEYVRETLLPEVSKRLLARTGYDTFFYGDFNREHTTWSTYSAQPRFGGPYQGLRGQMSILSEAYSYASFKDRVLCTLEFVSEIATYAVENRETIIDIHDRARAEITARGANPQPDDVIGIRHRMAAHNHLVIAKGWEYEEDPARSRRPVPTDQPHDYPVVHLGRFEPTHSVNRPYAYLIPPGPRIDHILELLRLHGVESEPFVGAARVQTYTIDAIDVAPQNFQGHRLRLIDATAHERDVVFEEESATLIRMAQPLGTLIVYMLEPESEDGFAAWDLFGEQLVEGGEYPILRIASPEDIAGPN